MPTVLAARDGAIATVTLNRPEARNALNVALLLELTAAFAALDGDPAVRVVVLTGAGSAFCAGADVKEWAQEKNTTPVHDWVAEAIRMMEAVRLCAKPVIARIDGACVGAGLDLALNCDFRLASARSKFMCSYTHVGYSPDAGGTWLLPRLVGLQQARRFIYTGELWLGDRAADAGLIDGVFADADLDAAAADLAADLAAGPTRAIAESKRLLMTAFSHDFSQQLALEQAAGKRCAATRDHQEALAAANEKRRPVFSGE